MASVRGEFRAPGRLQGGSTMEGPFHLTDQQLGNVLEDIEECFKPGAHPRAGAAPCAGTQEHRAPTYESGVYIWVVRPNQPGSPPLPPCASVLPPLR